MLLKNKDRQIIKYVLIALITVVAVFYPVFKIFGEGELLNWHIHQREFWYSGVQCISIMLLVFLLMNIFKDKSIYVYLFSVGLFMLMQGIIIPFLVAYVYFEIICFIGFVFNDRCKRNIGIISNFLAGITIWGFFGIVFSLMKQGTINDLRIMTVGLLFGCILLKKGKYIPIIEKTIEFVRKSTEDKLGLFFVIFLSFFTLAIAAKTNINQDFDSLWYMLKPEYMLVGQNSFYDYLGYSAFVYYYPKLVEFFFLPISGLGDYSFILIGNVFVYIFLIIVLYKIIDYICPKCVMYIKLLFVSVMATNPSLVSVVPSVKGDAFGCLFVFTAVYFFIKYIKSKKFEYVLSAFLALLYCTGTKLTFLLWGGIVGICMLVYFIFDIISNKETKCTKPRKNEIVQLVMGSFFIFGIHFRTFLLTGYPLYPLLLEFWQKIGFTAKPFMKQASNAGEVIPKDAIAERAYEFFFDPSSLSHTVMCWPTNIVLIFILATLIIVLGKKIKLNKEIKLLLSISLIELLFAVYNLLTKVQPDGNYFYFPFTIICVTCFYFIYYQHESAIVKINKNIISFSFVSMLVMTTSLSFVTNWAWALGIEPFSFELVGDNMSDYKEDDQYFEEKGIYKIAKYIENEVPNHRIIVSGDESRLKGSVENTWSIFVEKWSDKSITKSYEAFREYIEYANIIGFVVYDNEESTFKEYVLTYISENEIVQMVVDETATLYLVP